MKTLSKERRYETLSYLPPLTDQQILKQVIAELKLSESQVSQIHSGSRTELEYRLAWARTNAKKKGTPFKLEGDDKFTFSVLNTLDQKVVINYLEKNHPNKYQLI
jgi:restriction endonuclease Mrr